jgi:thiol:disulfide interchange protein DsbA
MSQMNRRDFSTRLAAAIAAAPGAWSGLLPAAAAQGAPLEGTHFVRLAQPLPVSTPGRIEVVGFFWYGSPHCNAFEPLLDLWTAKLPADVAFRRVPVAFRPEPFESHQKLFYALEAMGQIGAMHRRVFAAIHNQRLRLDRLPDIAAWLAKNGVDGAKFTELANSSAVQTSLRQARQLSDGYKIDAVPALGVHGRYYTSGTLAGSLERSLTVADWLIAQARKVR